MPLLVIAAFFLLYTQASPAFSALFADVSLNFISGWWMLFTSFGAYLLLPFFYPVAIRPLIRLDATTPDVLQRSKHHRAYGFSPVGLRYEYRSAWWLFLMLNGLLFLFNAVDIFYLITLRLPAGVSHSDFVHQGVNTLIISVVLAIVVVMCFFRGNLNFLRNNHRLKLAAYLWIVQNAILIGATASRKFSYISDYGLAYKRIGVYVCLLLTLIGLITTYIKVREVKSNWFLLRKNAWVLYVVLVLLSAIDWNRTITRHNMAHLDQRTADIDYLIGLLDTNLDLLEYASRTRTLSLYRTSQIQHCITRFMKRKQREGWPSWGYTEHQVYQTLALSSQPSQFR